MVKAKKDASKRKEVNEERRGGVVVKPFRSDFAPNFFVCLVIWFRIRGVFCIPKQPYKVPLALQNMVLGLPKCIPEIVCRYTVYLFFRRATKMYT